MVGDFFYGQFLNETQRCVPSNDYYDDIRQFFLYTLSLCIIWTANHTFTRK